MVDRTDDLGAKTLGDFEAIVVRKHGDGKRLLDGRAKPAPAPVDALEGEIAAEHHQAAAAAGSIRGST